MTSTCWKGSRVFAVLQTYDDDGDDVDDGDDDDDDINMLEGITSFCGVANLWMVELIRTQLRKFEPDPSETITIKLRGMVQPEYPCETLLCSPKNQLFKVSG